MKLSRRFIHKGGAMHRGLLLLSMVLLALAVAPLAAANKPAQEIIPAPDDVVLADQCAFPVLAHIEGGEIDTTFFDKAGNITKLHGVFPGQTLTATNLDTGKSITVVDAGSFQARAASDGSVTVKITGHGPIPNFVTGESGLWYLNSGQVLLTFDADGNLTSVRSTGNLVDLCTRLGS
jgi:hypothetical protein